MVWYSHLFMNFSQFVVIHTVKGFRVVSEAEIDVFLELHCVLHDSTNVGNLMLVPLLLQNPACNIWKFLVHILLKSILKDFEHNLASM